MFQLHMIGRWAVGLSASMQVFTLQMQLQFLFLNRLHGGVLHKPRYEPEASTGHVKSTTVQLWHSSQPLVLSKSVISALSNVLWGSNCTTDLTQMKPVYPFNSPQGSATTNATRKVTALSPPSGFRSLKLQKVHIILCCNYGSVSPCYCSVVRCFHTTADGAVSANTAALCGRRTAPLWASMFPRLASCSRPHPAECLLLLSWQGTLEGVVMHGRLNITPTALCRRFAQNLSPVQ